jgi:hypothetical protein
MSYLVVGPDLHDLLATYYRCRTLRQAEIVSRAMERHWAIVHVVRRTRAVPGRPRRFGNHKITTDTQARRALRSAG